MDHLVLSAHVSSSTSSAVVADGAEWIEGLECRRQSDRAAFCSC